MALSFAGIGCVRRGDWLVRMAGFLADKGLRILLNGYNVIPIKPGEKRPGIREWQKIETKPADVQRWLRNGHAESGVGVTTGRVVMVDLDIYDPVAVMALQKWVEQEIDFAPVRIGNAPKRGLLFQTAVPFQYFASNVYQDDEGRKTQVEVLGLRRQFVSHHIHPDTGRPYLWNQHDGPEFFTVDELPIITEAQCRSIVAEFERIAGERLWAKRSTATQTAVTPDDDDLGLGTDRLDISDDELRDILMGIPNDETFADRFDWFQVACSVNHQASDPAISRDIFYKWSEQHPTHNDAKFNSMWESVGKYTGRPITARYLLKIAKIVKERNDNRPTIRIHLGDLHNIATEAEEALIEYDAPLYTRGYRIVRPIVETVDASKSRRTKVARLSVVSLDGLVDWMSRAAKWKRFDGRSKKDVAADPPHQIAAILAARDGEWALKPLAGVITTPTLRPDGSLLTEPGYDAATRLLLLQPPRLPEIPSKPSKGQAASALRLLNDLLTEFPFIDEPSRAVALSGLISPIVRGALSVAPLHAMSAPVAGSGKSYIIDLSSAIATGRPCPVIAAGKTEEETEKRLGAILMAGQTIVSIDNLNGDLSGDFLCQAVERPLVQVRILGKSEQIQIESRATIFATGNNITIKGDMIRRSILCSLDPNLERPELREFAKNPFDTILRNRGEYIAAALTIVRAYVEAGQPEQMPPFNSFEDWSNLVRSALVWLGCADPLTTMERSRSEDPEIRAAQQIVSAWLSVVGSGKPKFVSELLADAGDPFDETDKPNLSKTFSAISRSGVATSLTVGQWLGRHKGRVIGGYKIQGSIDKMTNLQRWSLEESDPL